MLPLAEYLSNSYHPDCEYIDGVLKDRMTGEIDHSDAQSRLLAATRISGFWSGAAVRVHVRSERVRVPDVTIVKGGMPSGRIITAPPEVVVEVLSPEDRAADILDKIADYLAFGIPCVWVIRPETRQAWIHTSEGAREVKDGVLRNPAGDVVIPLAAIFAG